MWHRNEFLIDVYFAVQAIDDAIMEIPLIYLDQNVLGLQLNGLIDLSQLPNVQLVYSKEHFAEIYRSDTSEKYLEVLTLLDAKLIDFVLHNFRLTGDANIIQTGSAEEHYANYLKAISEIPFDGGVFDPLICWINGGGNSERLKVLPTQYLSQIEELNNLLPLELRCVELQHVAENFSKMIEDMISSGNDVEKRRSMIGGGKGRFGSIEGENQLKQIWQIIEPNIGKVSCDQFFGFESPPGLSDGPIPLFVGIQCCCTVLDILGFKSEKKSRKLEKIANVRSDATHIAAAAYCNVLLTTDKRMAERAKAIYEYKNIGTVPLLLSMR